MDPKTPKDRSHSRSRRNRTDLIDFSSPSDSSSGNNILDLFDPLSFPIDSRSADNKQQHDARTRARNKSLTSQPLELRRRDRRFRTTGATLDRTASDTRDKKKELFSDEFPSSGERAGHGAISDISSATSKHSISTFDTNPQCANPNTNSSTGSDLKARGLDDLTFQTNSSDEPEENATTARSDLSQVSGKDDPTRTNKIRLARKSQRSCRELTLLTEKLKSFRSKYKHHDKTTNTGIVFSPTLYSSRIGEMSVKIIITSPMAQAPINFTCNVSTTVEHIISHSVCSMFENLQEDDNMENYMLKVTGKDEYFDSKLSLADYALISHCWKFDLDVQLTLVRVDAIKRPYLRTSQDDFRCKSLLCPDDLLSRAAILKYSDLNYEALNIIIEAFEREAERLYNDVSLRSTHLQTQSLLQTTKAICSKMMNCETGQLSESKDNLSALCRSYRDEGAQLEDEDRYKMIEVIQHAIERLLHNMRLLLKLTSVSLPVDYELDDDLVGAQQRNSFVDTPSTLLKDPVSLRIHLISQLRPEWLTKYQEFHLEVFIKHGDVSLCSPISTSIVRVDKSMFHRLLFDEDLNLPMQYSSLPREARFTITLVGTELPPDVAGPNQLTVPNDEPRPIFRSSSSTSIASTAPMYSSSPRASQMTLNQKQPSEPVNRPLAVSVTYMFDSELLLKQGDRLIRMHTLGDESGEDIYIETIAERTDPVLVLEFKKFPPEKKVYFPEVDRHRLNEEDKQTLSNKAVSRDFEQLDSGTKHVLKSIIEEKQFHERLADDERALLWDNRLYLTDIPAALPKVLLSAPNWSPNNLLHTYELLNNWAPLGAVDALQLLLPAFPDARVREIAVSWISRQRDDELYDYIPQLVQAFRYEKTINCPLFWLLVERALTNVRMANLLYWQLKLNANDSVAQERSETLSNCLLWSCGSAFWKSVDKQEDLLIQLTSVSNEIKKVRDGQRMGILHKRLEQIQDYLTEKKPSLPWAPSLQVCDLEINCCSYFPSNTLPLRLAFRSCEESCNKSIKFHTYDTIFKMGDDLRQDMLAIQMIRIMEKLWLREGLDLRIVTFDCLATNDRQGMVEMVQNSETLRKIQQNSNLLVGSFNPKAIDNYIRLWNTSELEYKTALDKFLHSCAGYSVATYILGICDRHNDNIMVTTSGHLFHIDFGKFLGDAQMMGNIKRDRTPFVLTADMAYVINGGDRPSKKFQSFIELCTMGFNIIRRHRNLFLNLFSLMSSAKINGLDGESVKYIDKMLMPNLSEPEAMAKFTRLIHECLNSRSTQVNFFIHNLAQLRFSNENSKQTLLSFVPKTFTMQTDGKIESLEIVHLYKKYEPEKQYYYVVRVKRFGQPDTSDITRTFREFSELQMKLDCLFPCNHFHDINRSNGSFVLDMVGRNNTREVAQRRLIELRIFLRNLLALPAQISECDLIYTFFHPILRDQHSSSMEAAMLNESTSATTFGQIEYTDAQRNALYLGSNGQVKVSLSYKNSSLIIMIMHAKNLACPEGSVGPNCYAKTYLLPDPHKQTKKKTRVVRQSCHPSFMELIAYKSTLDALKRLTLQVSIWHSELVQHKAFMGAALIPLDCVDLSRETVAWYPLKNF